MPGIDKIGLLILCMIALAGVIVLLVNVRDGATINPFDKTSSPNGYANVHAIINAISISTIATAILMGAMSVNDMRDSRRPPQMSQYMGPTMQGPPMPQYVNTPPARAYSAPMPAQMTQPMNMQYGPSF
jgi:hypothetical protein